MGLYDTNKTYLVDIMGVATIVKIGEERYDEIYGEPTVMYSLGFYNKALEDLGENDDHTFEPMKKDKTTGCNIATWKRLKQYRLPFSETGYRSDFSNIVKEGTYGSYEEVIMESAINNLRHVGIVRDKYFDANTFEDKPIVSVVGEI
jgi:hypothetical protein